MDQQQLKVWNSFDEFGLLVGLGHWTPDGRELKYVRYPGETNEQLKERILKVYKNKSNSSYQGLVNALSRDLLTSEYNVITQYHYFLTEEPFAQQSGIHVYSSGNGTWSEILPQVRASGYISASSGWIVWNYPDNNEHFGNYTQILEILPSSLPVNETPLKINYQILDRYDEYGTPNLIWKTDMDVNIIDPDDYKFRVKKATVPDPSSQIVIHRLNNLMTDGFSGIWYTGEGSATMKLKEMANILNNKHPVEWGKIPWNTLTWENSANLSQGTLPTLFDADLPLTTGNLWDLTKFQGGVEEGSNLYPISIVRREDNGRSGIYAHWYPMIYPGKFYCYPVSGTSFSGLIENEFQLYENKQLSYITLSNGTGNLNGLPIEQYDNSIIISFSGCSNDSGTYYTRTYNYPTGSGTLFGSTGIYRRIYNPLMSDLLDTVVTGAYYIDNYLLSGIGLPNRLQLVYEHANSSGIGKIISGLDLNPYVSDKTSSFFYIGY